MRRRYFVTDVSHWLGANLESGQTLVSTGLGNDNPNHCQAITWINIDLLQTRPLGTNFSEM